MNKLVSKFSSTPVGDFLAIEFESRTEAMNFEEAVLPHLDAAYNLARWLTRNDDDAKDVVQESFLRALKFFGGFHGSEGRPWLLTIVRNTCYTWLKRNRSTELAELDEAQYLGETDASDPETLSVRNSQKRLVREALERLPVEFREVMVMRELEELSYKEIAAVVGIPLGTVMSRLARARKRLYASLGPQRCSGSPRASALPSQSCGKQAECMS